MTNGSTRAHAGHRAGVSDDLYLQTESDDDYQNVEDTMVVFCVDISGSMSVTTEVQESAHLHVYLYDIIPTDTNSS